MGGRNTPSLPKWGHTMAFLKSISYWSFAGGLDNTAPYGNVFQQAREAGFDAVEVGIAEEGILTTSSTREECRQIAREADDAGVKIASVATGLYWEYPFSASDDSVRKRAIQATKDMLRVASWLDTDALLVIPGKVDFFADPAGEIVPYDQVWERATSALLQCLPAAEKEGVAMALENVWNKFLLSPLEMKNFIDQFDSPWVGSYLDVGNAVLNGYPEQWIRLLGNRIKRVHLKDFRWKFVPDVNEVEGFEDFASGQQWGTMGAFCDIGAGDVNWTKVVAALDETGYDGPLTAEMLPPGPGLVERTSGDIDRALGSA